MDGRCGVGARERIERAGDVAFEARERGHDFRYPLAGQILKIASFEDLNHAIADVLRKPLLASVLERGRQVIGRRVDVFCRR